MEQQINTIIFDLGAVLIDWNPRYMYRKLFKTEQEIEWFLENIATNDWNENQDAGYPLAQATQDLITKHPEWENEIAAYYGRWIEMLGDQLHETVEIFQALKNMAQFKIYALTNWSAETFPRALEKFAFLQWFDGIVVSGEEKTRKPYPEFFQILLNRYQISPSRAVLIDDNLRNIKGAEAVGINGIHFLDAGQLKTDLKDRFGIHL
ncbi:HAD family phosphatase [Panacibacter sp. DH6]|uniref:HAD family phosphatase n=1 Tax=Panacibacter microcysteis TaxID=2793269 RepID=A0A931E7L1_9BACT|nr:HAD family phosphatase [Panacibacter microcysteis]MBG9375226.1 HAD family phosphatase [Panacibacter microcysteis]